VRYEDESSDCAPPSLTAVDTEAFFVNLDRNLPGLPGDEMLFPNPKNKETNSYWNIASGVIDLQPRSQAQIRLNSWNHLSIKEQVIIPLTYTLLTLLHKNPQLKTQFIDFAAQKAPTSLPCPVDFPFSQSFLGNHRTIFNHLSPRISSTHLNFIQKTLQLTVRNSQYDSLDFEEKLFYPFTLTGLILIFYQHQTINSHVTTLNSASFDRQLALEKQKYYGQLFSFLISVRKEIFPIWYELGQKIQIIRQNHTMVLSEFTLSDQHTLQFIELFEQAQEKEFLLFSIMNKIQKLFISELTAPPTTPSAFEIEKPNVNAILKETTDLFFQLELLTLKNNPFLAAIFQSHRFEHLTGTLPSKKPSSLKTTKSTRLDQDAPLRVRFAF
jgi:hypothetical protein